MPLLRALLLLSLLWGVTGCMFWGLDTFADNLNARQVRSCIESVGFPWPFTLVRIVTVTGGATFEECPKHGW
jgi:hypothetical protein